MREQLVPIQPAKSLSLNVFTFWTIFCPSFMAMEVWDEKMVALGCSALKDLWGTGKGWGLLLFLKMKEKENQTCPKAMSPWSLTWAYLYSTVTNSKLWLYPITNLLIMLHFPNNECDSDLFWCSCTYLNSNLSCHQLACKWSSTHDLKSPVSVFGINTDVLHPKLSIILLPSLHIMFQIHGETVLGMSKDDH